MLLGGVMAVAGKREGGQVTKWYVMIINGD